MAGLRDQTVRAKLEDDGERDCPHHRHGAPHGTPRRLPSAAQPSSPQPSLPILICKPAAQLILNLQSLRLFWSCLKQTCVLPSGLPSRLCEQTRQSDGARHSFLSSGDSKVVRVATTDGQWLGQGAAARREGGSGSAYARAPETPSGFEHLRVRGKKSRRGRLRSRM